MKITKLSKQQILQFTAVREEKRKLHQILQKLSKLEQQEEAKDNAKREMQFTAPQPTSQHKQTDILKQPIKRKAFQFQEEKKNSVRVGNRIIKF